MLISSSSGLLTALAVIATSVATPAPAPQQVDVCGLGVGVTLGPLLPSYPGPFNIAVIPTTALTPSVPLGYEDTGDGYSYLRLRGTTFPFDLSNNVLTNVIDNERVEAQNIDNEIVMVSNPDRTIQFSEQYRCVGNQKIGVLTAKGYTFRVGGFSSASYIHLDQGGSGSRNPALLQVVDY